jgi:hypothetical protein
MGANCRPDSTEFPVIPGDNGHIGIGFGEEAFR